MVDVRELWKYRDLLRSFVTRDIKLRYRQTALGVVWVVLQPLLAAGVFTFVFGRVAHLSSNGVPYLPFAYAGLMAWTAFSTVWNRAAMSMTAYSAMISKVYFPRLLLPLSTVGSALLDFTIAFVLQILLLIRYDVPLQVRLLLVPALLVITVLLAVGLGLMAAALVVRFRDVGYVLPIAIQLLLFASPVAYAVSRVPSNDRWFVSLNPLSGILETFRWAILGVGPLRGAELLYSIVAAVVAALLGAVVFNSLERNFADVI